MERKGQLVHLRGGLACLPEACAGHSLSPPSACGNCGEVCPSSLDMLDHVLKGHPNDSLAKVAKFLPGIAAGLSQATRSHLAELEEAFRRLRGPFRYDPASRWPDLAGGAQAAGGGGEASEADSGPDTLSSRPALAELPPQPTSKDFELALNQHADRLDELDVELAAASPFLAPSTRLSMADKHRASNSHLTKSFEALTALEQADASGRAAAARDSLESLSSSFGHLRSTLAALDKEMEGARASRCVRGFSPSAWAALSPVTPHPRWASGAALSPSSAQSKWPPVVPSFDPNHEAIVRRFALLEASEAGLLSCKLGPSGFPPFGLDQLASVLGAKDSAAGLKLLDAWASSADSSLVLVGDSLPAKPSWGLHHERKLLNSADLCAGLHLVRHLSLSIRTGDAGVFMSPSPFLHV